jgi:hypothetical protein
MLPVSLKRRHPLLRTCGHIHIWGLALCGVQIERVDPSHWARSDYIADLVGVQGAVEAIRLGRGGHVLSTCIQGDGCICKKNNVVHEDEGQKTAFTWIEGVATLSVLSSNTASRLSLSELQGVRLMGCWMAALGKPSRGGVVYM